MHHDDCTAWEYNTHPQYQSVAGYCASFLQALRDDPASKEPLLADTRPAHADMFAGVAPAACPYVAGNYRGSNFDCLRHYEVRFGDNEGFPALGVHMAMDVFHADFAGAVADLDAAAANQGSPLSEAARKVRAAQVMAFALQRFFTIHPFANGNGHMGRMLVWVGLARFGFLPKKWWLNKSPPNYGDLIQQHRRGNTKPLERYLIRAINGTL
jgi:hypothetical protein